MRCRRFQKSVAELLNGRLEGDTRLEVLVHAQACGRCATLLEQQRHLNSQLLALAADQDSEPTPPLIEQRLLSAFRAHHEAGRSSTLKPNSSMHLRRWLFAASLTGLILGAGMTHLLRHRPPAVEKIIPSRLTEPLIQNGQVRPSAPVPGLAQSAGKAREPVAGAKRRRLPPTGPQLTEWISTEVATEFYAIPYTEPFRPQERIRVMRTRVPRSVLTSFGVPVAGERVFDPIQADIMVGDDNVPRAIRFVQQWNAPRTESRHVRNK